MDTQPRDRQRVGTRQVLRRAVCVGAIALAVRLLTYAVTIPGTDVLSRDGDALFYHRRALGLIHYSSLARPFANGSWHPDSKYPPGYPGFLAAVYALAGENPRAALVVQAIVISFGIAGFFWLCTRLIGHDLAFAAAILWAIDPFVALHDLTLMTEGLATLCAGLGLATILLASQGAGPKATLYAAYGGIAGIGALVRPAFQFWVIACALPALVYGVIRRSRPYELAGIIAVLASLAVVAPWVIRNLVVVGAPNLTTFAGHQLYFWWAGEVIARRSGQPFEVVKERLREEERPLLDDWQKQAETDCCHAESASHLETGPVWHFCV